MLTEERSVLGDLRLLLAKLDAAPDDQANLERAIAQLDELFLLVIVGEFNSGKSTVINALIGQRLLEEGVTPTTTRINLLRYGPAVDRSRSTRAWTRSPRRWTLRDINVVDTPGTNAIYRQHEALTQSSCLAPTSCSSSPPPTAPSPRASALFLESIRQWGKKVVVILNKIDILESAEHLDRRRGVHRRERRRRCSASARRCSPSPLARPCRQRRRADGGCSPTSRFPALEELHHRHAGRGGAPAPEAAQPYRRRPTRLTGTYGPPWPDRLDLLRDDLRPSRTSTASCRCTRKTWRASSASASPTSTTPCTRWRTAASSSSTRRCASAASST